MTKTISIKLSSEDVQKAVMNFLDKCKETPDQIGAHLENLYIDGFRAGINSTGFKVRERNKDYGERR